MKPFCTRLLLALCLATASVPGALAGGLVELRLGAVSLGPDGFATSSCIQLPIYLYDSEPDRDLRAVTFTVEMSGDIGIVDGGAAANVLVANAFSSESPLGLTSPGTDLENNNGDPTPTCQLVHNQVTAGQGPAVNFFIGADNQDLQWSLNNDLGGLGRKRGQADDTIGAASIAQLTADTELMIAVLEIPVIENPGDALLLVTATANSTVPDSNLYSWDDNGTLIEQPLDIGSAIGFIELNIDRMFADGFGD